MSTKKDDINKEQEVEKTNTQDASTEQEQTSDKENSSEQELTIEEQLTEQLSAEKDKFIRLFAEFENFRKRTAKERIELFKTASEDVIKALLPVKDDFDRAILELEKHGESDHLTGIKLISNKLSDTLVAKGLEEVEIAKGDNFDVDVSEAVTQINMGDEHKGKVVDIIEKGYKLGDKIIRFPKVVIGA